MSTVHVNVGEGEEAYRQLLEEAVRLTLDEEGAEAGEVSLTLLEDGPIRAMNRYYLSQDRPTDVMAFALHDEGSRPLGDVYVGAEQARRQAGELGVPLEEELVRLAVHGTLHVLGYDHPEGDDRLESPMFQKQEALVRRLVGSR